MLNNIILLSIIHCIRYTLEVPLFFIMALANCVFRTPRDGDPLPERERIYSKNILFWAMEYISIR